MARLRCATFFRLRSDIAVVVVALALAMKLLLLAGFRPTIANGRIVVSICNGPATMMVEMPGVAHHALYTPAKPDEDASARARLQGLARLSLAAIAPYR